MEGNSADELSAAFLDRSDSPEFHERHRKKVEKAFMGGSEIVNTAGAPVVGAMPVAESAKSDKAIEPVIEQEAQKPQGHRCARILSGLYK